ncbi:MAG: RibD family protein [Steroidobacteraceae bacterium]
MVDAISDNAAAAWPTVQAAAALARTGLDRSRTARFRLSEDGRLVAASDGQRAALEWQPERGWVAADVSAEDRPFFEVYLPLCAADAAHPVVVAQLAQSLDGFIATADGDSHFVSGQAALLHLHRLRALCDAVVVGAGTVAADDPLLTTRLVEGSHPLRVVLDPRGNVPASRRVFDPSTPSLRICAAPALSAHGPVQLGAHVETMQQRGMGIDLSELLGLLRQRGCHSVLVEGGGVTVSAFLAAGLLDRLHLLVAPLLIGNGRPGIRLPPRPRLADCLRPVMRRYVLEEDMLFDCDLSQVGVD